jgi:hypothetical protein
MFEILYLDMVWIEQSNDIVLETTTHRIHQYTTVGTYSIQVVRPGRVEVLVVGGGGGGGCGGNFSPAGGGGGGGVVYVSDLYINTGNITVTVGSGGQGFIEGYATNGGSSAFSNIVAEGGGGGGSQQWWIPALAGTNQPGYNGASGGGGSRGASNGISNKIIGLGNNGASSPGVNTISAGGGGGGGAIQVGGNPGGAAAGAGGQGYTSMITGTSVVYGSGGGGGRRDNNGGAGGTNAGNGGGFGGTISPGGNAVQNCGGGGGGGMTRTSSTSAAENKGGNGGSGIVIVKYSISGYTAGSNVFLSQVQNTFNTSNTSNTPIWFGSFYTSNSTMAGIPYIPSSNSTISMNSLRGKTRSVITADYDARKAESYSNTASTTFFDLSGNGNNLTFNQAPTYNTTPFSVSMTSNIFASSTVRPINLQNSYSVEALFNFTSNPNNNFKLFSYTTSNNSNGIQLQVDNTNKMYLSNSQTGIFRNETILASNTWYHVVFTSSNTSYVNGTSNATTGSTAVLTTGSRTLTIGDIGGTRGMPGNIAFVKLYNYVKGSNDVSVSYESAKRLYPAYNIA